MATNELDRLAQIAVAFRNKLQEDKLTSEARDEAERRKKLFADQLKEFQASRVKTDEKGRQYSDWDESFKDGSETASDKTTAFNAEYKNAMLSLISSLVSLNAAIHNSVTEKTMPLGFALKEKIRTSLFNKEAPQDTNPLPVLIHEVQLDNQNALKVNLTAKEDPSETGFNECFRTVVVAWLAEQGYKTNPANKEQFIDNQGKLLTKNVFDQLKIDPEHGIEHYLTTNSDLEFEQRAPGMNP